MPWLNREEYIETNLRHYSNSELYWRINSLIYCYRKDSTPEWPVIQPPVEELEALNEAFFKCYNIDNSFGRGGEKGREKTRLRKELLRIAEQWGQYYVRLIHAGRIYHFQSGFEYFSRYSARKPGPTSTFSVDTDRKKGRFLLHCRKKQAILTWFHWEASEDGGATWVKIGRTRTPYHSTKKLDLGKAYRFRMYATNPVGRSGVAWGEYWGLKTG